MTAAKKLDLVSVPDYLAGELRSPIKHEYLGGVVYAMAGARNLHNRIAGNIFARLHARLRGKPCQPYNSDTKIRLSFPTHELFYYPDTSVVCQPNPDDDAYQDEPVAIVEVLSRKTRRIDEGEKKVAYLTLPSQRVYLMVEQDMAAVVVYRREGPAFNREVHLGLDAVVPLPEIETELPLAEIYEGLNLVPEPGADDE